MLTGRSSSVKRFGDSENLHIRSFERPAIRAGLIAVKLQEIHRYLLEDLHNRSYRLIQKHSNYARPSGNGVDNLPRTIHAHPSRADGREIQAEHIGPRIDRSLCIFNEGDPANLDSGFQAALKLLKVPHGPGPVRKGA